MIEILNNILKDLNKISNYSRNDIFTKCISDRLNKSIEMYYSELLKAFNKLDSIDELKVIRRLDS